MFDVPVDAWYLWLGAATASLALLGSALALPTTPAPDAASVADTVDSVAASPYAAVGEHPLTADEIKLTGRTVALGTDGATGRARFAYGPVVPVRNGPLRTVLVGTPPQRAFESPETFGRAVESARDRDPAWRPAPDRLLVRRVTWGGVDVTLVG